jgi:hypothetical protein
MSISSYVHRFFHAGQRQADLHALRWKDRPFQCTHCQSLEIRPWSTYHYRPGCKRYRSIRRQCTFNGLPQTLLAHSKRSLAYWIFATFLLCLVCSSHRIAWELGVYIRTSYRWC